MGNRTLGCEKHYVSRLTLHTILKLVTIERGHRYMFTFLLTLVTNPRVRGVMNMTYCQVA